MAGDRSQAGIARDIAAQADRAMRGLRSEIDAVELSVSAVSDALAEKEDAGAVLAHEALPDPHVGYQKESEKGAANGYASLGAGGLVPIAQLASGTPDGTKFVRDDGTLVTPCGGGGGGATFGTATVDFGAFPGSNEASVAVTGQAAILGTSKVDAFIMASDTSGSHTANDHRYAALLLAFSATTPDVGVGFTIHARCLDKMQGTFAVRWRWS